MLRPWSAILALVYARGSNCRFCWVAHASSKVTLRSRVVFPIRNQNERSRPSSHRRHDITESWQPDVSYYLRRFASSIRKVWRRRRCLHTKRPFFSRKSWLCLCQVSFNFSLSHVEQNCINVFCVVGFMIDVTEKMLCMPWMEEWWMVENFESSWLVTVALMIPLAVVDEALVGEGTFILFSLQLVVNFCSCMYWLQSYKLGMNYCLEALFSLSSWCFPPAIPERLLVEAQLP